MSDRFVRQVSRATLQWTVEVQSLFDREQRRLAKVARRLRTSDPELAERLRSALAEAVVDRPDWPERVGRLYAVMQAVPDVPKPHHGDDVTGTLERGVGHVAKLQPPPELAGWHAAVVAAQREYLAAMQSFQAATSGDDVDALVEAARRVERARATVHASLVIDR